MPGRVKKRVRLVAVTQNPMDVVNIATGEVQRATPYVGNRAWRDVSDFVKVFDTDELLRMGKDEFRVFVYGWSRLEFNGKFDIEIEDCMEHTGLSRASIYRGLDKLVKRDAIRRDGGGAYWVNPNIAFRGNRDELMQIV